MLLRAISEVCLDILELHEQQTNCYHSLYIIVYRFGLIDGNTLFTERTDEYFFKVFIDFLTMVAVNG
jgi:hypothetical protein